MTQTGLPRADEEKRLRILQIPFHPFFLAPLVVLAEFQVVKQVILPETTILTFIAVEVLTAVVYAVAFLWSQNLHKAAFLATIWSVLFFSYTAVQLSLSSLVGGVLTPEIVLAAYITLAVIVLAATQKNTWRFGHKQLVMPFETITRALNPVSLVLLIVNTIPIATYYVGMAQLTEPAKKKICHLGQEVNLSATGSKPDVYYIIVDGCAHPSTMKEVCGYDNHEFIEFLKRKGFYVVDKATSNYNCTELSLCSSLNMEYLDPLPKQLGSDFQGFVPPWLVCHAGSVPRLFQKLGYKFINICSFSCGTDIFPGADTNWYPNSANHFLVATAINTPLSATEQFVPLLRTMYAGSQDSQARALADVVTAPSPKFVLFHTDMTHPPYLRDQFGRPLPLKLVGMQSDWGRAVDYGHQIQFAETRIRQWIELILSKSANPPVIIIQGDHGPGEFVDVDKIQHPPSEVRMKILNAYYFPGAQAHSPAQLYDSITPVNSFRVVFNHFFSANLPLLKDHAYWPAKDRPYDWTDIRDQIRF